MATYRIETKDTGGYDLYERENGEWILIDINFETVGDLMQFALGLEEKHRNEKIDMFSI